MSTLAQRLQFLRGKQSRKDFAALIGVKETTLRNYEQEQTLPTADVLTSICTILHVSPQWLLIGEGDVVRAGLLETQQPYAGMDAIVMIPMVEAVLSAGGGSLETSTDSERSYAFRQDFVQRKGNPKDMVIMRVSGDSMEPEILNGDVVLIDQAKTRIVPGQMYAVGFEEAIYLKRIDMLPGKVLLKSVNSAYPLIELDVRGQCKETFRVIGRVLWSGREYK